LGRLNKDDSTENDLHDPEFDELIDKANLQDDFFQKLGNEKGDDFETMDDDDDFFQKVEE
jgi:hypothetical protein